MAIPLICTAKNYDWGKHGLESKVAILGCLGEHFQVESVPYAELWIGTHPNGPSTLKSGMLLRDYLGRDLKYLTKILSIKKPLSIQVHPDKQTAQELHLNNKDLWDPNHKPEMAIALTNFEALLGFNNEEETIKKYPELLEFGSTKLEIIESMFQNQQLVESTLLKMLKRTKDSVDETDVLLRRIHEFYPGDVGVWFSCFLNHVKLNPGEAIFIEANEVHAYLSGDCYEVMATSDNVIRAGLTSKPKDYKTMLKVLNFEPKNIKIIQKSLLYNPIDEFQVKLVQSPQNFEIEEAIFICLEGEGYINEFRVNAGSVFLFKGTIVCKGSFSGLMSF